MKYVLILMLLFCGACTDSYEEFKKNCPYELPYGPGHYLTVPITITPHKLSYSVGDTIYINTIFSDSIYDRNTKQTFKIRNFPFKPMTGLYRFYDGLNWDSGYTVNDLYVDSSYRHVYHYSSDFCDNYRAYTIYENDQYRFESRLILKEPGRYVLIFTDMYQEYLGAGLTEEYNTEADSITFEGKCPMDYYICSMIEGDNHLELFVDELVYLDEYVHKGRMGSTVDGPLDSLRSGDVIIEFAGFYGFEVVE